MNKKTTAGTGSVIFGVAFVWFTTHFGGGFALVTIYANERVVTIADVFFKKFTLIFKT